MGKFCVFCGKPLEEGQECDCQKEVVPKETPVDERAQPENVLETPEEAELRESEEQQPERPQQSGETPVQVNVQQAYDGQLPEEAETEPEKTEPQQTSVQIRPQSYMIPKKESGPFANYVKRCWVILTHFFAHPVQIIRIAAEKKDCTAGILFWIINAIIAGMIPAVGVPRVLKTILGSYVMQYIDYPVGLVWLEGSLSSLLWTAILSVLAFAFAKAMRSHASFKSVMGAVGVSCIGTAAINVISWLLIMISPGFGICFYLFTQALAMVLLYIALAKSLGVGQDKALYCLLIAVAIVGLMMALYISGTVGSVIDNLLESTLGGYGGFGSSGLLR